DTAPAKTAALSKPLNITQPWIGKPPQTREQLLSLTVNKATPLPAPARPYLPQPKRPMISTLPKHPDATNAASPSDSIQCKPVDTGEKR
ncbi:hypothetical protein, partial [Streptomyces sp. NPDC007984]|uniref:hypothetical protein n=1 Tax=Streptomyces sp. NPDC007984 TaxID=3364801 RepID=UPI0036EE2956